MFHETERLKLRLITEQDAGFMLEIWNDPAFIENIYDKEIRTREEAEAEIRDVILPGYEENGFGMYRVSTREDDVPVGVCGLVNRDSLVDVDLGYAFLPQFGGRGYALEAAGFVLDEARDRFGLKRVVAIVSEENGPSIRLLERSGFTFEKMIRLSEEDDDEIRLYGLALKQP